MSVTEQFNVPRFVVSTVQRSLNVARERAARAAAKVRELEETMSRLNTVDHRAEDPEDTAE